MLRPSLVVVVLVACGESSSSPPTAPMAAVSLDVPPLPPPKPTAHEPVVRKPEPAPPDDTDETPRTRDPAAAEVAFQDARRAMAAGDFARACGLFRDSLRLDRAAGTLLNLAMCEEKLGDRKSALKHYLAAEAEAKQSGRTDRAAFAHERAEALKASP